MTDRAPVETKNLDRYGFAELPWSRPRDILAGGSQGPDPTHFLGTSRPDGRPHAAGIGAIWLDGDLYFTSGPGTQKARNLATNPACTISVRLEGIDLMFEGRAIRVTDEPTLNMEDSLNPQIDKLVRVASEVRGHASMIVARHPELES